MAYASGSDLVARYDVDLVGALSSDAREPVDDSYVPNHPHVAAALADASGEIDVALLAGGRYTVEQLGSLTGNSRQHLIRVTCDIAMSLLFKRRADPRYEETAANIAKQAREHLQSLRRGENVFGLAEAIDAGILDHDTVSARSIESLNLITQRMDRFFPRTDQRTPRF